MNGNIQRAFEEGAGVLEVLVGAGFGGGDTLKRFVEDADDPMLFWERRVTDIYGLISVTVQIANASGVALHPFRDSGEVRPM